MNETLKVLGMTEEKAISILERLIAEDEDIDFYSLDEKMSFEVAISALKDRPKREWIPTIERLPKVGDTVLCSVKPPECTYHHIIICKYCAEEFWKDGMIRAWQPLPEPYKAESEE